MSETLPGLIDQVAWWMRDSARHLHSQTQACGLGSPLEEISAHTNGSTPPYFVEEATSRVGAYDGKDSVSLRPLNREMISRRALFR